MPYKLHQVVDLIKEIVQPSAISPDTKYIGLEHINENDLSLNGFGFAKDIDSSKYCFKKNDILFGKLRPYFRKVIVAPFDGICSTDIWVLRPKVTNHLNSIFYWISSQGFIDTINRSSDGTRMPRAKWEVASELEMPELISSEFASLLRNLDEKRSVNVLVNQSMGSISQALFKSWFVDFDPVRAKIGAIENGEDPQLAAIQIISGKSAQELSQLPVEQQKRIAETADLFPSELEQTEDGEIPKGWKWRTLYSTAEYINGAAFKATDFSADGSGFPIVKIAELKSGITPQTKFTIKAMDSKYEINNGAMLYSWSGSPETSLEVFKWFGGKGWLNQHIFLINTESDAQKVYVFNLLRHLKPVLIEIAKNKQTTGLGHVTVADMKRIMVPYPDENGLKLIQDYLYPLYEMDSNNIIQIENLRQQRDTLIPKLLSGELQLT